VAKYLVFIASFLLSACHLFQASVVDSAPLIFEKGNFSLAESKSYAERGHQISTWRWTAPDRHLNLVRYQPLTTQEAQARANDRKYLLLALYQPKTSPYPQFLSNVIVCNTKPKFIHEENGGDWLESSELWANDRGSFGVCNIEQQKQLAVLALVYCAKAQAYFELEMLVKDDSKNPKNQSQLRTFLSQIKCAR
jgi:hypothetical protein